MTATYTIVRRFFDSDYAPELVAVGLTLAEAREWCSDPETSSETCTSPVAVERTALCGPWFDSYEKEQ